MLQPTFYDGKRRKPGESAEVPDEVALRWINSGIAKTGHGGGTRTAQQPTPPVAPPPVAESEPQAPAQQPTVSDTPTQGSNAGSAMTLATLRKTNKPTLEKLAAKRNLDISAAANNIQRADIIWADIQKNKE